MTDRDVTPVLVPSNDAEPQVTELYRYFAADGPPNYGRLLYVGISLSALHRAKQHHKNSDWMAGATRMTIERFQTRQAALQAEVEAIRTEFPAFNITHAVDEDTRIRHYLAREAALKEEIEELRAQLDDAQFISREFSAHRAYRLTARGVVSLIKRSKPGMYGDGNNLYLKINRSGGASWIFRYGDNGQTKQVTLGSPHVISLSEARDSAFKAQQLLRSGVNPQDDPRFNRRRIKPVPVTDSLKASADLTTDSGTAE